MSTYAIGDIQGCYDELQQLLDQVQFDAAQDRLWLVGDLVNRGPKSLETLRFIKGLGERATTVLGNHDLHLLAVWKNPKRHAKSSDTLRAILRAPDCDELMDWLRHQPLLHHENGWTMVHAGLSPEWTLQQAIDCAREVETVLQGPLFEKFLEKMYGDHPNRWDPALSEWERWRYAVNCFTRIRFCQSDGSLDFKLKGGPGTQPDGYYPWYQLSQRSSQNEAIVFGHWSTLGYLVENGVHAIDSGCLWGGNLTALRLEDMTPFHYDCPGIVKPKVKKSKKNN